MKYALVIPDGCADESQDSLGGLTPLQAADVPNMDVIAKNGIVGNIDNVPASMPAGSDVGTMSLFGYDPLKYHTGRAPIEAVAQGIELGPNDWAVRCNLVSIEDGVMVSFTAGQIPNDLARELMGLMQADQADGSPWQFCPGVSYRNLLLYRDTGENVLFTAETITTPPHDVTDQAVAEFLPKGPGSEILRELMDRSASMFAECPENLERKQSGELPATGIWLWGEGRTPNLETFSNRFGKTGAVITAVDLMRGLGTLLGWKVIEVPTATGYIDTDYAAKGRYAIAALQDIDLIVVHVEAPDEASHEGDAEEKVRALENIDREIVGPLFEHLEQQGDYRLLVSPDHPTFLRTKTHSHGYVPFAMCGTGIEADSITGYDEVAVRQSPIRMPGYELMPMFLEERRRETSTARTP